MTRIDLLPTSPVIEDHSITLATESWPFVAPRPKLVEDEFRGTS